MDCRMNLLSQVANKVKKVRVSCGASNIPKLKFISYGGGLHIVNQEAGGSPCIYGEREDSGSLHFMRSGERVGAPAFMRGKERFSAPGKKPDFDYAL
jgi:hypothetical protein